MFELLVVETRIPVDKQQLMPKKHGPSKRTPTDGKSCCQVENTGTSSTNVGEPMTVDGVGVSANEIIDNNTLSIEN